jgi:hypothetical protein
VIEIAEMWKTKNDAFQIYQDSLSGKEQGNIASELIFEFGWKNI